MTTQKIIIDCDTGVDDAQAIMMALSRPDIEVIGITCVNGNVDIENVCRNTLRVLTICDALKIPVFRGCVKALTQQQEDASFYHGVDGMGDLPKPPEVDLSLIQEEHAVNALIRLTKEFDGEVKLVCLAPLTNLAIALRMDPGFGTRLKSLVVMGGNMHGKGNRSASIASEFNFGIDPEAAYMVLHEMACPIVLVSWELCLQYLYPWEKVNVCLNEKTPKANFLQGITKASIERQKADKESGYRSCDAIAMAVAIDSSIVMEKVDIFASVELHGTLTRGMLVPDWRNKLNKSPNVTIVTKTDTEKSLGLWMNMVHVQTVDTK